MGLARALLTYFPVNQPFSNLMERYSGEAELAKQKEELAIRRQRTKAKVFKVIRMLMVLGMMGTGVYYFKPIKAQLDAVTAKVMPSQPQISDQQQAKINAVNQAGIAHANQVDAAMR